MSHDYVFKILLIGDSNVGKTSLLVRFCDNQFPENHKATIGIDFKIKSMKIIAFNGVEKSVKLQIWDTAGSERHICFTSSYYRGANAAIIVFALDSKTTYDNVQKWIKNINDSIPQEDLKNFHCKILVGNKSDLNHKRVLVEQDVQNFAYLNDMTYIETSAKTGAEVENMFVNMAQILTDSCIKSNFTVSKDELVFNLNNNNNNNEETEIPKQDRKCCSGT